MSTDFELRYDLPQIRSTSIKIKLAETPTKPDSILCMIELDEQEVEECKTPTSLEHKIPVIRSCPPAPKKQRLSCKRIIPESDFFERDEIDSFFKSSYELMNRNSNKRRRCLF